jgi:hypothetical protein
MNSETLMVRCGFFTIFVFVGRWALRRRDDVLGAHIAGHIQLENRSK